MTVMKKISLGEFLRLKKLIHRNARPLDFTKWKYLFENGSCEDFPWFHFDPKKAREADMAVLVTITSVLYWFAKK